MKLLKDETGAIGPIGGTLFQVVVIMLVVGITAAMAVIGAVLRDQSAYASIADAAITSAAHDVSTRELAGGAVVIDASHAATSFTAYLTSPTGGDLVQTSPSTFIPVTAQPGVVQGPAQDAGTVKELTVSSATYSPTFVHVDGWLTNEIPAPVLSQMRFKVEESITVTPAAVLANVIHE